ncbi:MAG TPA: hypothetical protein VN969_06305 [Streptosporangiaceae bacterium]|nr:hypothetical protein [Streptosporangiaceae bacterium]
MRETVQVPNVAEVNLPPWLGGGDPSGFFENSGLVAERIGNSATRWRISNKVPWDQGRPILVTVNDIAGPGQALPRFNLLSLMVQAERLEESTPNEIIKEVNRMGERAETSKNPVDSFAWVQMATIAMPAPQLRDWLTRTYEGFTSTGMENDFNDKVFANAGIHIVRRSLELLHRIKLASVSLQLSSDYTFDTKTLEQIKRDAHSSGESIFASSEGLYDGIYTLDAYLAPLYGSLIPAVWAFPASRILGVIIFSLGQPLAGSPGRPTELLHLLPSQGPTESSSIPSLTSTASSKAIRWWISKLNDLLTILSDPTVFTDQHGVYVPSQHLHTQLTVEQLFRRVFSMQDALRDSQARRVLFFTALDTLDRLTAHNIETLCDLEHAKSVFSKLKSIIPVEAAEILLPGAERGVSALERLQDGFFIGRRTGTGKVEWSDPELGPQSLDPGKAAAHYIRLLRDATHGHGTKFAKRQQRTDALLTNHNGKIPHDLGWLSYLYLLDLLARPDDLRQRFHGRGKL